MSLISCEYASSIHVACLKVPHFKEPTQHSSVQICTPGPQKTPRIKKKEKKKKTETQLAEKPFDDTQNPTKSVIFMSGFFHSVFEDISFYLLGFMSLKAKWQKMSCFETNKALWCLS